MPLDAVALGEAGERDGPEEQPEVTQRDVDTPKEGRAPDVSAVAALGEPTRRRPYDHVVRQSGSVSRDEAAAALGLARKTAAFHLDRPACESLLDVVSNAAAGAPVRVREGSRSSAGARRSRSRSVFRTAATSWPDGSSPGRWRSPTRPASRYGRCRVRLQSAAEET